MATLTSRLGLTKPVPEEDYSVSVVNTNSDLIDAAVGVTPATSATRPSTQLFEGRAVHESDTGEIVVRRGAAWSVLGTLAATANRLARRGAGGRLKVGTAVDPDDAVTLAQISGGDASYMITAGATFAATATSPIIPFGTAINTTPDVTANADGTFTLNRAGVWMLSASMRVITSAANVRVQCAIGDGAAAVWRASSQAPGTGTIVELPVDTMRRLPAGQKVAVTAYAAATSSIDASNGPNMRTGIDLVYLRP